MAGISGMSIEDTDLPQPFGTVGQTKLLSVEEGVGKMKGALEGRKDPDLVIAGRTSAAAVTGIDDAIARAQAYEAAGVDAIFLVGVKSREELDKAAAAIKLPFILGSAGPDMMDLDYLSSRNVRICLQGHQPFSAAVQAVHDTLKALRDGTAPKDLKGVASADLMKRVTRDADYQRWTKEFLG